MRCPLTLYSDGYIFLIAQYCTTHSGALHNIVLLDLVLLKGGRTRCQLVAHKHNCLVKSPFSPGAFVALKLSVSL